MLDTSNITNLVIIAIALILSIWVHEYAHAFVSDKLWDPTPKNYGRLTPNPIAHIDLMWLLMVFLIHFGWGKPVPINPSYYKNPKIWEFLVSIAGPITNIILSFATFIVIKLYTWQDFNQFMLIAQVDPLLKFFSYLAMLNIWLAIFNLLPIPPLDGRKFIKLIDYNFFTKLEYKLYSNPFYVVIPFLILMYSGISKWIGIVIDIVANFFIKILS